MFFLVFSYAISLRVLFFAFFSYGNSIASWYTLIKYLFLLLYHFVRECFRGTCFCHQNYFYVQFIHFLCGLEFQAYTISMLWFQHFVFDGVFYRIGWVFVCVYVCCILDVRVSIFEVELGIEWYMHIFGVNFETKYAYNSNWKANEISTRVA